MGAVSVVALVAALAIIRNNLNLLAGPWGWLRLACYLLASYPLYEQSRMGQSTALLLLLLTGSWAWLRSGRPVLSGVLLGVATCIKLFPGLLLLYLAVTRRWRALAAAIATIALVVASTSSLFGVEVYRDYFERVLPTVQQFRALWQNLSLVGFWSKLFNPAPEFLRTYSLTEPLMRSPLLAAALSAATVALVVAALVWASWRGRDDQKGQDLGYASTVVASLLIGPLTWGHSLLLLPLPFSIFWASARGRATRVALVTIALILFPL